MKPIRYIEHYSPIPYYHQLKQIIIEEIERGTFRPGDRLPGEHELCRTFGVSRTVVRQALSELDAEGEIQRRKGRGSFVAHQKVSESLFQNLTGLYEDVASRDGTLKSCVRRLEKLPAPDSVAQELSLAPEDPIIVLERLRLVDDLPWVFTTTYIPYEIAPGLLGEDFTDQSLYALLEGKYSVDLSYGRRSVEAASAPELIAKELSVEPGDLILFLRSTSYGTDGRPVEHFVAHHRGDRSRFEVTLVRRRNADGSVAKGSVPNLVPDKGDVGA